MRCSRRICFCALGFPRRLQSEKGKREFLQEVDAIQRFLSDPWLIKAGENATVQVEVPKVVASPAAAPVKRVELQKHGAAVSIDSGDLVVRVCLVFYGIFWFELIIRVLIL